MTDITKQFINQLTIAFCLLLYLGHTVFHRLNKVCFIFYYPTHSEYFRSLRFYNFLFALQFIPEVKKYVIKLLSDLTKIFSV